MTGTAAVKTAYNEYDAFVSYRQTHDPAVREDIVEHNLYIASILSKRYADKGIEYDDIYQVACLGLLYAVERFDPERNMRFATFATPTVTGEIKKYFRDKGNYIRVPRRLYEIFVKAEKIRRSNAEVTDEELARRLQIPVSLLQQAQNMGSSAFIQSLEEETGEGSTAELIGQEDKSFIMIEDHDFVDYCFSKLSEREAEFVRMRYFDEQSQREIAEKWGVSQMYVSRLERKVLEKIKHLYFKD